MNDYPSWTCQPCGLKHGTRQREISTWHEGTCDVCGKTAQITQVRDFGHFPEWFERPQRQRPPKKKKPARRLDSRREPDDL